MKKLLCWILAFIITIAAAYYQRTTGPTYPKKIQVALNGKEYDLRLVRSIEIGNRSEVRLKISDTTIKARIFYRRYHTNDSYEGSMFTYKTYPINSWTMNKVFKIFEESGYYADVPQQPAAGKIQYYLELTDSKGTTVILKNEPVVIRFKGAVPAFILAPHILLMFIAMLFSTLAGLMCLGKNLPYRKYSIWTLALFVAGGIILGPIVQNYAFGELWTGIPFGWDLTDNKTLIALIFWIIAVIMNWRKERRWYVALAAIILLLVYSIPHSMFGSELNYTTGTVNQGIILNLFI
jgi:hypothetical protein